MAMKKDKKTGGTDNRYVSSLEKKVAKLESEVENLKADRKQLKEDLQKERKKKDVKVIEQHSSEATGRQILRHQENKQAQGQQGGTS